MAQITIADTSPRVQYTVGGSATTGPWAIPWPYFETGDIKVYFDGTLKEITTHYTISGTAVDDGFSSGAVTAGSSQSNITVTIERDVSISRTTDFPAAGVFNIGTLNTVLDKLFAIGQWLEFKLSQVVNRPSTSTETYSLNWPDGATSTQQIVVVDSSNGITLGSSTLTQWIGTDGTVGAPYYSYVSDPNTGFYRIGADNVGLSLGGVKKVDFGAATTAFTGEVTGTGFTGTLDGSLGSGTPAAAVVTQLTSGGNIVSDTDSTDDLGTTSVRWANTFTDAINSVTAPTAQYTSAEETKLAGIETSADVTDSTNVVASLVGQAIVANSQRLTTGATVTGFDTTQVLGTSDVLVPTQNAIKTYVDNQVAASAVWSDVVYLTSSDSVYTISANGTLYVCDTSGGAITINLPAIGTVGNGWASAIKKSTADTNSVTVTPSGSEEIDEASGSVTIGTHNSGRTFISDIGATPDSWTTMQFGATGGNMTVQNYTVSTHFTAGSTTALTVSSSPASEQNIVVTFDGVTQHHNTYSISGTTVTFSSAIPTGTANVEIRWGGTLSINAPADGTVTAAKMAANSVDSDSYVDGSIDPAHLASNAVTTAKIAANNVTIAKIETRLKTASRMSLYRLLT